MVQQTVADAMTPDPTTVDVTETIQDAARLMTEQDVETAVKVIRDAAVRRVPVLDGGTLVGIVSIGDLAFERDPSSALADISDAEPNR